MGINFKDRVWWMQDDSKLYQEGAEYQNLNAMLVDLRAEVESYVSAYALDMMYDVMELTKADLTMNKAKAYLMLRECGTWLIWEEDADERLSDLKNRYNQWIIFELTLDKTSAPEGLSLKPFHPWKAQMVEYKSLDCSMIKEA